MGREDFKWLRKPELVKLVLRFRRPAKASRISSKSPLMDRKERCERSCPGGSKPGRDGHKRVLSADPESNIDHRPTGCPDCGMALSAYLPAEVVSVHEETDILPLKPWIEPYRRRSVCCPGCGARGVAEWSAGFRSTRCDPRLHVLSLYLRTFQVLSYEQLGAL